MDKRYGDVAADGGDPTQEIVDVVDDDNRVLRQATRGEVYAYGLRHRGVAVLCRNSRGDIFVHRRAASKQIFPSLYDIFVGGGVEAGETYGVAARRELEEELGTTGVEPSHLFTYRYDDARCPQWIGVFEARWDGEVRLPPDEIAWGDFLPESTVIQRLDAWNLCPDSLDAFREYRNRVLGPTPKRNCPSDRAP